MTESTNPFDENDEVNYPRYKDPFAKRTKSVKKMKKQEKKMMKEKHKQEKKEEKVRKKHGKIANEAEHITEEVKSPPNNNKSERIQPVIATTVQQTSPTRPMNGSSTLPLPTSPNSPTKTSLPGHQTLNNRTPTAAPQKSPLLPNKRIAELRTLGGDEAPRIASKTNTTPKKQIYVPSEHESQPESIMTRPNTLKLGTNADQVAVAPVSNHATSPLTRKDRADDDVTRLHRTSSVSKVNKEKKKKRKKLRMRLKKKKKKSALGEEKSVLEGQLVFKRRLVTL